MGISCSCGEYEPEPGDVLWQRPLDFSTLSATRRKRCKSCNKLIDNGGTVLEFVRTRVPDYDVEVEIYGEDGEIEMASHYLCEECGGLWLSIEELGVCADYDANQRENVLELNATRKFNLEWKYHERKSEL